MMASGALAIDLTAKTWTCEECGEKRLGLSVPDEKVCLECQAARRLDQAQAVSLDERLSQAGVPWRYRQGWDRSAWTRAFGPWPEEIADWTPRSDRCVLLIHGGTGTGKSGLAAILLTEALDRGRSGLWVRAQSFVDAQKAAWDSHRANHPKASSFSLRALQLEEKCRSVELLVLDDLFAASRSTPYALERFQDVAAERFDEGMLTAVTTNRTEMQLRTMLPSLESRLASGVVVTPSSDQDLRRMPQ